MASRCFGWRRDLPDRRDLLYRAAAPRKGLPRKTDLRPVLGPVYDQKVLSSCTAQAAAAACRRADAAHGGDAVADPSRLFIYYATRVLEKSVEEDCGATLRGTFKALNRWGYPDESLWPYDLDRWADKPHRSVYKAAQAQKAIVYARVAQEEKALVACLAGGLPVVFGLTVYDCFSGGKAAETGIVTLPGPDDSPQGGHAICLVGHDAGKRRFLIRNSWGDWGLKGYGWLPYAYILDPGLAADFWVVRLAP